MYVETMQKKLTEALLNGSQNISELAIKTEQSEIVLGITLLMEEQQQAVSTGDKTKIAEARQCIKQERLGLPVCIRQVELLQAVGKGDKSKIAEARFKVKEAVRATKALSQATEGDRDRCERELEFTRYELCSHRVDGGAGAFISGESGC